MAAQVQSGSGPFPNELWEMIFDHGEQRDFFEISFVSRRLHHLVEPYLYWDFNWIPEGAYSVPQIWILGKKPRRRFRPAPPPPFLLLRTLIKRPELANCVKHVKLLAVSSHCRLVWDTTEANRNALNDKELGLCYKILETSSDDKAHWKTCLLDGRLDVIVCTLLVLLRNVSSAELRVRHGPTYDNAVFQALHCSYGNKGTFTKRPIKSVTISLDNRSKRNWTSKFWWSFGYRNFHRVDSQMTSLALLPQLEHLSVSNLHDGTRGAGALGMFDSAYHAKLATNLKKLVLHHSLLTEHGLELILSETLHLEELICDLQYDCGASEFCFGNKILTALSKVSGTLRRLKLNIEVRSEGNHDNGGINISMGWMKDFKKLRSLVMPLILITPRAGDFSERSLEEILPDRLETVMLRRHPLIPGLQ